MNLLEERERDDCYAGQCVLDLDVVGEDVVGEDTGPLSPGEVQAVESVPGREGGGQTLQLLVANTQLCQSALYSQLSHNTARVCPCHTSYLCWLAKEMENVLVKTVGLLRVDVVEIYPATLSDIEELSAHSHCRVLVRYFQPQDVENFYFFHPADFVQQLV